METVERLAQSFTADPRSAFIAILLVALVAMWLRGNKREDYAIDLATRLATIGEKLRLTVEENTRIMERAAQALSDATLVFKARSTKGGREITSVGPNPLFTKPNP